MINSVHCVYLCSIFHHFDWIAIIQYTFHSSRHSVNIAYAVMCDLSNKRGAIIKHTNNLNMPNTTSAHSKGQGSFWIDFHNILHNSHMEYIMWRCVSGVSLVFIAFLLETHAGSCVDLISWKEFDCMPTTATFPCRLIVFFSHRDHYLAIFAL